MSSAPPETGARLRGGFGFRLGLWYAGLFGAGGLALVLLTYALLASALAQRDRELVLGALQQYVEHYRRGGLPALQDAVGSDRVAGRNEGLFVRVLGPGAEALFGSLPSSWRGLDLRRIVPPGDATEPGFTQVPGPDAVFEVASVRLADGTLFQVGKSSEARADVLRHFRARAALLFLTTLALAVLGGLLVTRGALAPLRRLSAVLRGLVRTGEVGGRVPVRGDGDPLDDLGRLFNEMLDRIGALISGLKGALDNVAHDLRTPLARLRMRAESALREGTDAETLRRALAQCVEETDRVASTLTAIMDISEAETGALVLRREPVELGDLLRETAEIYEGVAEDKGVDLAAAAPAGLRVTADRVRLRQALANLVDNAVKYTPRGGHVRLGARAEAGRVVLECADDGPGIAPEDRPRIWDRLYRGDQSRSEKGLGLGLSLVRAIAHAHGGEASVEPAAGGGSLFRLSLPASITDL
ncbi:MAG TPA: ATP-binding protein [Vicinamibacteria bacterium]